MIENITVKKDATAVAPTGGTDTNFTIDGYDVPNGIRVSGDEVDFRVCPHVTYKNRFPTQLADGKWSKAKRFMVYTVPVLLDDGSVSYNVLRCEVEFHPSLTAAQIEDLVRTGSQFITDPEASAFILKGSLR